MHHQASQAFCIDFALAEHKIASQTTGQADHSVFWQHSAHKKLKHLLKLVLFNSLTDC